MSVDPTEKVIISLEKYAELQNFKETRGKRLKFQYTQHIKELQTKVKEFIGSKEDLYFIDPTGGGHIIGFYHSQSLGRSHLVEFYIPTKLPETEVVKKLKDMISRQNILLKHLPPVTKETYMELVAENKALKESRPGGITLHPFQLVTLGLCFIGLGMVITNLL